MANATATRGASGDLAYAGDVSCRKAWDMLSSDKNATLVDVRTLPEWQFVGAPHLDGLNKEPLFISWRTYPTMEINPRFVTQLSEGLGETAKDAPLLFMCKSGGRSLDAAIAATKAGYSACYNIAEGFEGALDAGEKRGSTSGWKAAQLPWRQL